MTRNRFAFGCVAIGLLGVVACGTAGSAAPSSRAGAARTLATPSPAPTPTPTPTCGTGPPRRAWAQEVSAAGKVTWQVRLPTDPTMQGIALQPVVIGGTAIFAEENVVYALRLANGHQLWKRAFPLVGSGPPAFASDLVYGLWQYRGSVIVLVGQASSGSRLLSLNAATGAVSWYLRLGKQGETGNLTLTGDGGLAMIYGYATLTVVDLTTGKIRWGRTAGNSGGPIATGGVLIAPADRYPSGKLMGYSSRTGKLLWTRTGLPSQPEPQPAAGLVLVPDGNQVIALSPATGRTVWRLGVSAGAMRSGPAGLAIDTHGALYLVNPVNGRVRWHVSALVNYGSAPLVTSTDVVYVGHLPGGPVRGALHLVDLRVANGSMRWSNVVTSSPLLTDPVVAFGGDFVVSFGSGLSGDPAQLTADRQATGRTAWTVEIPTLVGVPLAVAGADLLVQPTDPSYGCF